MLVQLPCDIKEARHSMQFQPLCFRTIVVLLICHLFKDGCIFVFIAIFYFKKFKYFCSLKRFMMAVRVVTITNKFAFIIHIIVRIYC